MISITTVSCCRFQSTLRRTERLWYTIYFLLQKNFNPRSGERSDELDLKYSLILCISIHAPANGATKNFCSGVLVSRISIHAPANGATLTVMFLPVYSLISIHAPANGATYLQHPYEHIYLFQSTLRRTERHLVYRCCISTAVFQSTLRRTERRFAESRLSASSNFNPRSGERSDGGGSGSGDGDDISIHAPANGATSPKVEK